MERLYVPTEGTSSWKSRLADPEKHWKRGASALEAAVSWERAARTERGLPPSIAEVLDQVPDLSGASLLLALPEHKVVLPGGSRSSQTDVWALLRSPAGLVSMAVEAKADEAFGETIEEWLRDASDGKTTRLTFLCETLGTQKPASTLRYQLMHRTASAILEAKRWGATAAVMMVQCFRTSPRSFDDFLAFGQWLGVAVADGKLIQLAGRSNPTLYLGWACSPLCSDSELAQTIAQAVGP